MTPELVAAIIALLAETTVLIKVLTDIAKIKRDRLETKETRDKDSL